MWERFCSSPAWQWKIQYSGGLLLCHTPCESLMAPNCWGRVLIKTDIQKRPSKMFITICNPPLKRENNSNGNQYSRTSINVLVVSWALLITSTLLTVDLEIISFPHHHHPDAHPCLFPTKICSQKWLFHVKIPLNTPYKGTPATSRKLSQHLQPHRESNILLHQVSEEAP